MFNLQCHNSVFPLIHDQYIQCIEQILQNILQKIYINILHYIDDLYFMRKLLYIKLKSPGIKCLLFFLV